MRAIKYVLTFCLLAMAGVRPVSGFTLLGPFAPWMTPRLGYHGYYDIGGPVNIGEGYRWNVPVLTYGFDPSFVEFFGSNGVAAVESAIQVLNDLPPASVMDITNHALLTSRVNYRAEALGLLDLKSLALSLPLEQMGLASPTRYIFTLQNFTDPNTYSVVMRNFDPQTLTPSMWVNGTPYWYYVLFYGESAGVAIYQIDPSSYTYNAVADNSLGFGGFYTGLTYDDVGGLRYLYNTNNVALENLIPGVRGAGRNKHHYVKTALRPGVDKITFQRLGYDSCSHKFIPITSQFVDSYITNNAIQHQTLERVITQPDFLFSTTNLGWVAYSRTGTSNWVNNGPPSHDGPGVIQPPISINFDGMGPNLSHYFGLDYSSNSFGIYFLWGSFGGTINLPVTYPIPPATVTSTEFDFWLFPTGPNPTRQFSWNLSGKPNDTFLLQTSSDLSNWSTITSVTNAGWNFTYFDQSTEQHRFFRTIPQ